MNPRIVPPTAPSEEAGGAPRSAPWSLLALLIAMSGVGSMSLNILAPAIPGLVAKFATDAGSVQLTISLYIMGLAVAQLVFGPLSDRFGRRPVLLVGLGLATLASTAAIFVVTIGGLVAARVVQSLGASTGQTISRAIIRDLYDRERAAAMIGLVTSVVVLMPMMAPLLGGILDTLFGWASIFIFVALFSGAVFLWAAIALPETRRFSTAAGRQRPAAARLQGAGAEPAVLRLRAVRRPRLGAVLQLSRRRAARHRDDAGPQLGRIRPVVLPAVDRLHGSATSSSRG